MAKKTKRNGIAELKKLIEAAESRVKFAASMDVGINTVTHSLKKGVTPGLAIKIHQQYGIPLSDLGYPNNCTNCGAKQ